MRLSLLAEREALAVLERCERGGQAGEADHRVEHDVDLGEGRQLGEHVRGIGTEAREVEGNAELGRLLLQQLAVARRGQGDHLVFVAVVADDVERLRADRPGRSEDGDAPHPSGPIK